MAPVLDSADSDGFTMKKKDETEEKENLCRKYEIANYLYVFSWVGLKNDFQEVIEILSREPYFSFTSNTEMICKTSILAEVQRKGSTKLPSCKQLLVLGDNESGKTTLIAKLQGVEDPKKGSALEYAYIDVRDEYREDHTRLSVWVLDGEPAHAHLLRYALSTDTFPHTTVVFVVAMTTPWSLLEQLENWASILQDHIDKLNIPSDQLQELRLKYIRRWQEYVELAEDLELDSQLRRTSRNLDDEGVPGELLPLGEGVLLRNLGLDVVVVVTKVIFRFAW
ncbi:Cytoplasmic dynein 1 light intermediate chain 1 [Homalodisca vitripennis]|nr:Cytoplasmic dynein 1 light intermediate chain 1 [Homalodisca vitripennis]